MLPSLKGTVEAIEAKPVRSGKGSDSYKQKGIWGGGNLGSVQLLGVRGPALVLFLF